jgi:type I restriction enzyme S subunit
MRDGNTTPAGFKYTEIGILPKEWEVVQLVNVCKEIGDGIHATPTYSESGEYYFINGNNISDGKIFTDNNTKKVTTSEFLKHQKKLSKKTVLLSINGTIGNIAFYNGERLVLGKSAAYLTINDNNSEKFIYYIIQTFQTKRQFDDGMTGSTIKNLGLATIRQTIVPLPTIEEQKIIANVLSDIDALIIEFEKLIAKKQAIKTATMQQLLTGRTRLTEFAKHPDGTTKKYKSGDLQNIPEDWEEREIGKFAPLQRGFDLPASKRSEGLYPVVYSNGIVNTHNHFQVKGPGVVTGRSGTLGKVHHIECDFWPHNTSLWVTKFINSDSKFVYYIFKYIGFERFASGSGVPTLNRNDAHSFKVAIPSSLKEQTAIAAIFSDMDAELTVLEKKLAKIRDIKQGMMQQLLTGSIRLPLDNQP